MAGLARPAGAQPCPSLNITNRSIAQPSAPLRPALRKRPGHPACGGSTQAPTKVGGWGGWGTASVRQGQARQRPEYPHICSDVFPVDDWQRSSLSVHLNSANPPHAVFLTNPATSAFITSSLPARRFGLTHWSFRPPSLVRRSSRSNTGPNLPIRGYARRACLGAAVCILP